MNIIRLLEAAAFLTVVFSLLTGLDIPHRNVELFSHFRLQYFVASIVLLPVFVVLRNYPYITALGLAAIFNATLIVPWYIGDTSVEDGVRLKLMHVNVLSTNNKYERLLELVAAEDPDLIFLQEMTPEWVAGTRSLLQNYSHAYVEPRDGNFGIAVFSKIPFDSIQHVDSPPLGYPTIIATISIHDAPLTLISSHPTIPLGQDFYDARNSQMASLAEMVNNANGPVVLLGDFNSSIWCTQFKRLQQTTGLNDARKGFGILPTWPTYLPFAMIPIDHVLVSAGISVSDIRTGTRIGSDHLPLIVTLAL